MSNTTAEEVVVDERQAEIIDHNIAAGYVTYIVDRWEGDRNDPTVGVVRYIGVWREEQLEKPDGEAFDPPFWPTDKSRYSYRTEPDNPKPLVWQTVETTKEADHELVRFKNDQNNELEGGRYRYGTAAKRSELYQKFMDAIDTLAKFPESEAAWKDVERWRNYNAKLHEK